MALTLEDLRQIPKSVQDLLVDEEKSVVTFRLVCFSMDMLHPEVRSPVFIDCQSPLVASQVVLSKTEMTSDGTPIPGFFLPQNLENTLSVHLRMVKWTQELQVSPKVLDPSSLTVSDLLAQAAIKFKTTNTSATGFTFGQEAMSVFNRVTPNACN